MDALKVLGIIQLIANLRVKIKRGHLTQIATSFACLHALRPINHGSRWLLLALELPRIVQLPSFITTDVDLSLLLGRHDR